MKRAEADAIKQRQHTTVNANRSISKMCDIEHYITRSKADKVAEREVTLRDVATNDATAVVKAAPALTAGLALAT